MCIKPRLPTSSSPYLLTPDNGPLSSVLQYAITGRWADSRPHERRDRFYDQGQCDRTWQTDRRSGQNLFPCAQLSAVMGDGSRRICFSLTPLLNEVVLGVLMMPPDMLASEHRREISDLAVEYVAGIIVKVIPIDVVDMKPRVQEVMMCPFPDNMRARNVTGFIGVGMSRTRDGIPFAGSASDAMLRRLCSALKGGADLGAYLRSSNRIAITTTFGMTLTTPPRSYAADMLAHDLLYPEIRDALAGRPKRRHRRCLN